jgi:tripartite-type tricarboxylate transporter receptor subunit TctC
MIRKIFPCFAVMGAALACSIAVAQNYPTRPVRFVVPFPAGGGVDLIARSLAQKLTESWGQQVIVDNRSGANGTIATDYVAKAAPDGYTILIAFASHTINAALYEKLPYDPQKDFAPITIAASVPNILVVHPSLPVKSVKELIALARAQPGKINYSSAGSGSPAHMSAELFNMMANIKLSHVPYKGGPPSMVSVLSGETSLTFTTVLLALPYVKAQKMRALGVTSLARSPVLPTVATVAETLPNYESAAWYGMLLPAASSKALVSKIYNDVLRVLKNAEFQAYLASQGAEPIGNSPEQFAAQITSEIGKWRKVVVATGAKID